MAGLGSCVTTSYLPSHKQQLASVSPRPSTSRSQPGFTPWLCLGISKPSTSSSHLRLLCNSGRVASGETKVGTDLGLHHPGNPRASAPSGQLQTTLEHHHPAPAQLVLHGEQRLVVSGHSQSLQLTGLGMSLPLTCQQQPRLSYRGGCTQSTQKVHLEYPAWVMGRLYHWTLQVTYTLAHTTNTRSQSSST